ncbi:MAG: DUF3467 domain-containing protein [Gammaproteobacteria bacterium]
MVDKSSTATAVETGKSNAPTVNWDDSAMQTSYANVVNAFSTREEFTLLFGTNQTWSIREGNQVNIRLSDRLILNPLVAKRLWTLMGELLKEYEARYGALEVATPASSKEA